MAKESPLKQEMGPKKFDRMVEKTNKFYDEHKAGRRDPKTGQYYYSINFDDPRKKKLGTGKAVGSVECSKCSNYFSIAPTTVMVQCHQCRSAYKIKYDRETDTVEVTPCD